MLNTVFTFISSFVHNIDDNKKYFQITAEKNGKYKSSQYLPIEEWRCMEQQLWMDFVGEGINDSF